MTQATWRNDMEIMGGAITNAWLRFVIMMYKLPKGRAPYRVAQLAELEVEWGYELTFLPGAVYVEDPVHPGTLGQDSWAHSKEASHPEQNQNLNKAPLCAGDIVISKTKENKPNKTLIVSAFMERMFCGEGGTHSKQ